jgi:hypothetical protein
MFLARLLCTENTAVNDNSELNYYVTCSEKIIVYQHSMNCLFFLIDCKTPKPNWIR